MSSQMSSRALVQQAHSYRASDSVTESAIYDFFSSLSTPRSLACWLLYSNGEHQQLVDLEIDPFNYENSSRFRDDYLATNFLSKANFLSLGKDKKSVAMEKFFKYEEQCRVTNRRFKSPQLDPLNNGSNVWLLNATKRKIEMILGDFCPDEVVDEADWGPGVSTLVKGEAVSGYNKFQSETGITRDLYSLVAPFFETAYPLWSNHLRESGTLETPEGFTFERGNKIVTVPKNAKTDRVIAVEPGINLWFQKAVGKMLKKRLRRNGVDLEQQDRNQQFAHEGAFRLPWEIGGHHATVDFSSASDSISSAVVEELLPRRWFVLMNSMRSAIGVNNKEVLRWQKFSSMGNGYTFELESLIFYAAALAVCEYHQESSSDVSVFGDDVIIPANCYSTYSEFCAFLGFTVNLEKSFASGQFRESCGAHYFGATDCKPLYLKGKLRYVQDIYKLANGLRLLAHRIHFNNGCDRRFSGAHQRLCNRIPKHLRFVIPRQLGDVGIIGNFDEACPALPGRGFEGFLVRGYLELGLSRDCEGFGLLLDRIRRSQQLAQGNTHALRGRTRKVVKTILVSSWYNLGGWV